MHFGVSVQGYCVQDTRKGDELGNDLMVVTRVVENLLESLTSTSSTDKIRSSDYVNIPIRL